MQQYFAPVFIKRATACVLTIIRNSVFFLISVPSPPTNFRANQNGLTSVELSWEPQPPLDIVIGYEITYTINGGRTGIGNVTGALMDRHTLTDPVNGAHYEISIRALSQHLPSENRTTTIRLGKYQS